MYHLLIKGYKSSDLLKVL